MEFPHLMRLMEDNQFDTIYHEHFSYFSLVTAERIFAAHGLDAVRRRGAADPRRIAPDIRAPCRGQHEARRARGERSRAREQAAGLEQLEHYGLFAEQVRETKRRLLDFLIWRRRRGKSVVGYGAPGKGNTLLNYCGIRTDLWITRWTATRTSRGSSFPGHISRSIRPSGSSRPGRTTCSSCRGISRTRSWSRWVSSEPGADSLSVPIPDVKVYP